MTEERIKLGTMARVQARPNLDATALLNIAKERAPDASVFDTIDPFFWQVRASSNRLDFYDTRMRAGKGKTLDNFARALGEGVSYQDSHKSWQNGWGQSLTGRVVGTDESDPDIGEKITEVWGELFTLPGMTFAGQSTDSMIAAIRSGVWRDVSVGFYATDIECSICGKQSFRFWEEDGCTHIPGVEYKFEDRKSTAFAWINDGELVELSQVYKGASPSAAVLKAEQMSSEGMLSDSDRAFIARRHNVRIAEPDRTYALGAISSTRINTGKEDDMSEENKGLGDSTRTSILEALGRAASKGHIAFDPDSDAIGDSVHRLVRFATETAERAEEAESAVIRVTEERDAAKATIQELEPQAEDGKRYRANLIEEAIAAGSRALGKEFREEMYRGILESTSIEHIRGIKDDFTKQGDAVFAARKTVDQQEEPGEERKPAIDPDRYRS